MPYANNKGAGQPAHSHSLISAFVVRCLDSTMHSIAKSKISRLQLVYVAEQVSLRLTCSNTSKDRFSRDVAHMVSDMFYSILFLYYSFMYYHGVMIK